jgi:hypothetical protein
LPPTAPKRRSPDQPPRREARGRIAPPVGSPSGLASRRGDPSDQTPTVSPTTHQLSQQTDRRTGSFHIRRRSTNKVVVIDFKSNDRTQQEEETDLQLRVYALGYEEATGERAGGVVVDKLDDLSYPRRDDVAPAMLDEAARRARRQCATA